MKTLLVGLSTLAALRENNAVYVDKTQYIHRLMASGGSVYFLSRPRRFGKSLLLDTMRQLFLGKKELFEGTWIAGEGRHDWQVRPVLHIDFSGMPLGTTKGLLAGMHEVLDQSALEYNVDMSGVEEVAVKLGRLLRGMSARGKVVVLIDEYDAPIIKNILSAEVSNANRKLLAEFYTVLKALAEHLHFVFLTGVSKFSKTSIFSGMNNIIDIGMEPEYAAICGYTQEELEENFDEHLEQVASFHGLSLPALLDQMRFWYNGYRFSSDPLKVYNPYSVLLFLRRKNFSNYWFETGTPTFLMELVQKRFSEFQSLEEGLFTQSIFSASDPEKISLIALLYQTGYATIKEYFPPLDAYSLTYPNEEVRQSFSAALLGSFLAKNFGEEALLFATLKKAMASGDAGVFCKNTQSLLASIPYNLHIERESYYHSILHTVGLAVGGVVSELATSNGRADLVLQSEKHVFVIELKIDESADAALAQIKDRRYYEPFMNQGRTVHLIGLNLAFEEKVLTSVVEAVAL